MFDLWRVACQVSVCQKTYPAVSSPCRHPSVWWRRAVAAGCFHHCPRKECFAFARTYAGHTYAAGRGVVCCSDFRRRLQQPDRRCVLSLLCRAIAVGCRDGTIDLPRGKDVQGW